MQTDEIRTVDRDTIKPDTRRLYTRASLIALAGNTLLVASKAYAAVVTNSSAVYADAANSASDVAHSMLMGIGLWLSLRPPDEGHPHGHQRIEPLVSLFIGLMMGLAGFEAGRTAVSRLQEASPWSPTPGAIVILFAGAAVKGAMFLATRSLGTQATSPALLASAKDNLNDIVSSVLAIAGLALGQLVPAADTVSALVITVWIVYGAWTVIRESFHQMLGGSGTPELREAIVAQVSQISNVVEIDRVIMEYSGPKVYVDIHIRMDPATRLDEVHRTSHAVREAVQSRREVDHAFVHVEPTIETPKNAD